MRKAAWKWGTALVFGVAIVLVVVFWPWVQSWLPHPNLVEAWIRYAVDDLNIDRWAPWAILLLIGVIELVWALVLGRRAGAQERQVQKLERFHDRELDILSYENELLNDERRTLWEELKLREDLVREEKVQLWTQLEGLQRACGLSNSEMIMPGSSEPSPDARSEWRQLLARLERIDAVDSVIGWRDRGGDGHPPRAGDLLRLGVSCYHLGQYERALTHFDRVVDLTPNEPWALLNRGVAQYALRRDQAAVQDLGRALKMGENSWAYLFRAMARERQGDHKRALEDYTRAVQLDAEFKEGYYHRGLLHAHMGEMDKAFQDQSRVIELDPRHAAAYAARGVARAALGDDQWVMTDLDKSCALAPDRHEGFYERGRVWFGRKNYDQALSDFTRAIEQAPEDSILFMARGDVFAALGEHEQSLADYDQSIRLMPNDAQVYLARGKVWNATKEYARAVEDYDQALALEPDLAEALACRGEAHGAMGNQDRAIGDLDRAIALDPSLATAYYFRGLAYGRQGEYDRASRDLNKAAELDPVFASGHEGNGDSRSEAT